MLQAFKNQANKNNPNKGKRLRKQLDIGLSQITESNKENVESQSLFKPNNQINNLKVKGKVKKLKVNSELNKYFVENDMFQSTTLECAMVSDFSVPLGKLRKNLSENDKLKVEEISLKKNDKEYKFNCYQDSQLKIADKFSVNFIDHDCDDDVETDDELYIDIVEYAFDELKKATKKQSTVPDINIRYAPIDFDKIYRPQKFCSQIK